MLFLFRSAPEVEKRIHSKLFRKFWRSRGTKEPAYITVPNLSHALDHSLVQVWHLLPEIPEKRILKYLILSRIQIPIISSISEKKMNNVKNMWHFQGYRILLRLLPFKVFALKALPKFSPGKNASKVANVFLSSVSCVSYPVVIELLGREFSSIILKDRRSIEGINSGLAYELYLFDEVQVWYCQLWLVDLKVCFLFAIFSFPRFTFTW